MPIIIEWTYADGTTELEKIPAEIWRYNEQEVTKVFMKDKEVIRIALDPNKKTADVQIENNLFPREETVSRFDKYKQGK
jgi:hypothetical protein